MSKPVSPEDVPRHLVDLASAIRLQPGELTVSREDWLRRQLAAVLTGVRDSGWLRPAHDPMTDCNCEPGDVLSERGICEYRQLADSVDEAFNPPGDDVAEVAILIGAVERARDALAELPCQCAPDAQYGACPRCRALGQADGKPVQR